MKNMYDEILKVLLKSSTILSIYKKKQKNLFKKQKNTHFHLHLISLIGFLLTKS